MMSVAVMGNSEPGMAWWKRTFRSLGAVTGLFTIGFGVATSSVAAQEAGYRSAASVPLAWQAFATQLQRHFEQRLASDEKDARTFQDYMTKRETSDAKPPVLKIRAWILPNGKIDRLEFDGLGDDVPVNPYALLARDDVGVPPADMLQPLHLRLSLRPKDQAGGRK
jgi:hypothetical protein